MTGTTRVSSLCIVASIRNLAHIESAYGTATALTIRHVVCERARDFCSHESGIVTPSGEHIVFLIDRAVSESAASARAILSDRRIVEAVVAALGDAPVLTSMGPIRAAIGASIASFEGTPFDLEKATFTEMPMATGKWRTRYAFDMNIADELLGALERDELCFRYEKVCSVIDTGEVKYFETLLCRTGNGVPVSVSRKIPALERLGLVSRLDRWVVTSTIETLRANRDI